MNKPLFDIVVIAKNESKTLPRLVSSVKEFMDRGGNFYVLDTGSNDDTIEVAKKLGCIVHAVGDKFIYTIDKETETKINSKFIIKGEAPIVKVGDRSFNYAEARNYISNLTENSWCFSPDCDEILTSFNIDEINKIISDTNIDKLTYNFVFSHDEQGNPAIAFLHSKFFDKTKWEWRGRVHEVLMPKQK